MVGQRSPVSRTGEYPPDRVGLPDAILLGRDELQVEIASDLPQRQPAGPVLTHHSDRHLLGTVLHELVVRVIEAEGQVASPLAPVPVPRGAEPVQSLQHRRPAGAGQTSDLPGGQVLTLVEPFEKNLALQTEQGRQRENALYQRGECTASV